MDKEWILRNFRTYYSECNRLYEYQDDEDDFLEWAFSEVDKAVTEQGFMIYNDPTNRFEDVHNMIAKDMQIYSLHYSEKGYIENYEFWIQAPECWDDIVATYIDEHFDKLPKHNIVYVVIGEVRNVLNGCRKEVYRKEFEHSKDAFQFLFKGDGRHLGYRLNLDYNPYIKAEYRSY